MPALRRLLIYHRQQRLLGGYSAGRILIGLLLCMSMNVLGVIVFQPTVVQADVSSCVDGTQPGIRGSVSHSDPNICYICTTPPGGNTVDQTGRGNHLSCSQAYTRIGADDNLMCPSGLYRGHGSYDSNKCYHCTAHDSCQEANVNVFHNSLDSCDYVQSENLNIVDRECFEQAKRTYDRYMDSLKRAAPTRDYRFLDNGPITKGSTATEFCKYYELEKYGPYPEQMFIDACYIGYDYGFGQNRICSDQYLGFVPIAPHANYPNQYARTVHRYLRQIDGVAVNHQYDYRNGDTHPYIPGFYPIQSSQAMSVRGEVAGKIRAACQEGYMQYRIDYYYCGSDDGCKNALRADRSRIFDPKFRPQKTTDTTEDGTQGMILPQLTSSGLFECGSTQTAYFTCTGGSTATSSAFWQLMLIILNILTGLIAIIAVGGVVWGALRYAAAGDDSGATAEARAFIRNVLLGLVLYVGMWAIIQYIVPGGLFS